MKKHIEELKIGDIISENIFNVNTSIIAKQGDSVTERILNILKMWGVKEISIKSVKGKRSKKDINTSSENAEEYLGINSVMDMILNTSKKIIAERIDSFENE